MFFLTIIKILQSITRINGGAAPLDFFCCFSYFSFFFNFLFCCLSLNEKTEKNFQIKTASNLFWTRKETKIKIEFFFYFPPFPILSFYLSIFFNSFNAVFLDFKTDLFLIFEFNKFINFLISFLLKIKKFIQKEAFYFNIKKIEYFNLMYVLCRYLL